MFVCVMTTRTSRNNVQFWRTVSGIQHPHERIKVDACRHVCRRPKVYDLDIASSCQQKVFRFDISMYNANRMESLHSNGYLSQDGLDCLETSV